MKHIKKDIHFTAQIELTEAEIQTLLGVLEDNCVMRQIPFSEMKGLRGEIYSTLKEIFITSNNDK